MRTIAFLPAAYNLAETTRMIEVAKACRDEFDISFASHGGEFEKLIEDEGFSLTPLEPRLTPEKIEYLYKVDQGEKLGAFFTVEETRERVRNEVDFLTNLGPVASVTGFNMTLTISSRAAKVPLVWLIQSTWDMQVMMDLGLGSYMDDLEMPVLNLLSESKLKWLTRKAVKYAGGKMIRPLNVVAKEYQVKTLESFGDMWEGDYNLLAEPPDFSGRTNVPDTYFYIGPLIAHLDTPVPEAVTALASQDTPMVYFAMGSSGRPKIIKAIIEGFNGQPFNVVSPMKSKIKGLDVNVPPNVVLTDWLPALEVSRLADISVIHGGIGTVMTAALAGKPVVGVGMMYEQEYNLECLVRKGFAKRIRRPKLRPDALNEAIKALLEDEKAKETAKQYAGVMEEWVNLKDQKIRDFFRSL